MKLTRYTMRCSALDLDRIDQVAELLHVLGETDTAVSRAEAIRYASRIAIRVLERRVAAERAEVREGGTLW